MVINSKGRKIFQIALFVLLAVVLLGIGYAGITAVDLIVNGHGLVSVSQANFIVHFISTNNSPKITTGTGSAWIKSGDDKVANFEVTGLSKKGDYAVATYTVKNDSKDIGADISIELEYTNCEWFKVTEEVYDSQLKAGDTTTVTVTVELLKTPIDEDISTLVTGKLIANPIENDLAVGNDPISDSTPYISKSFAMDSWATIQGCVRNNQTGKYKVGDTKTVTIDGVEYTLRIVNIASPEDCDDESYSETACGFVVEFADIVSTIKMNNDSTNVGGYASSLIPNYLNGTLYNKLPEELREIIIDTRVVSGHGNNDSNNNVLENQKLYLLSSMEIFGSADYDTAKDKTRQLDFYKTAKTDRIEVRSCGCSGCSTSYYNYLVGTRKMRNGTYDNYWLRDARSSDGSSFSYITSMAQKSATSAYQVIGISPAFRIK